MGIALGLGAALSWGLADYFAARTARRVGTLGVVLGFHLAATALLAVLAVATGALDGVSWPDVPFFVLVGALGWGSYLAFYRALAIGPISIVSPIVSGYAAVTVVLAVAVLGERLSALASTAVALSLLGVVIASADVGQILRSRHAGALGLALAVVAMLLIGGFVFGVAYRAGELGWLAPVFLARGFSMLFLLAQAGYGRSLRLPVRSPRLDAAIGLVAVLDTAGYVSFNLGARRGETAIVAAASAPYAVIPILMGVLLFHERPRPTQWAGVALVLGGLVLLGLAA